MIKENLNERGLNLVLYAKGRYPKSDDFMRDVSIILGDYAGVDPNGYSPEMIAKIVVDDLGEVVQGTCNKANFGEFLLTLAPNHPWNLVKDFGFYGGLVHGILGAVRSGTTTSELEAFGVHCGDVNSSLASRLMCSAGCT